MIDVNSIFAIVIVIGAFDTLGVVVSLYLLVIFRIKPYLKFKKIKTKRGIYLDVHSFDDETGDYEGSLENMSVNKLYQKITGLVPDMSIDKKIDNTVDKLISDRIATVIVESNLSKIDEYITKLLNKKVQKRLGETDDLKGHQGR